MTVKQTTSTNILRGLIHFLTVVSENTEAQPIASVESAINNLRLSCDIFRAADALQVPASKLLALAEWFEAGLVINGWEVSRGSDDNSPEDAFLTAVTKLLNSEYGQQAALHARLHMIAPNVPSPTEGTYRSVLLNHLYAHIVNKATMEGVLSMSRVSLHQYPIMSTPNPLRSGHHGVQFTPASPWAHRPIQGD